jgi:hypothetical protein
MKWQVPWNRFQNTGGVEGRETERERNHITAILAPYNTLAKKTRAQRAGLMRSATIRKLHRFYF